MIIDATDSILGRVASFAAKKALSGEKVDIINCENAVITGNKKQILRRFKQKKDMGIPLKGPYYPRTPEMIVRRTIRGMLPYKKGRGKKAYEIIKCYAGIPEKLKNEKAEIIKNANISKLSNLKYVKIKQISRFLGAKI